VGRGRRLEGGGNKLTVDVQSSVPPAARKKEVVSVGVRGGEGIICCGTMHRMAVLCKMPIIRGTEREVWGIAISGRKEEV